MENPTRRAFRLQGLLLSACVLFYASALEVLVPYYGCVRNDPSAEHIPGICSMFTSHHMVLNLSNKTAAEACASDSEFNRSMAGAVTGWDVQACYSYVEAFVSAELSAITTSRAPNTHLREDSERLMAALDDVAYSFGKDQFVEGSVWRYQRNEAAADSAALAMKRLCLLTSLAAAVPHGGQIAEIGFNVGHSAGSILSALSTSRVTSFDICSWPYTRKAHEYLASIFGSRTKLVCGDSGTTVPSFDRPPGGFDAIFIDGGHTYPQALADLRNSARLMKDGALVIVDDCEQDPSHVLFEQYRDVGSAWRHCYDMISPLPDVCGHVGLCLGHYGVSNDAPSSTIQSGVSLTFLETPTRSFPSAPDSAPDAPMLRVSIEIDLGEGPEAAQVSANPNSWVLCSRVVHDNGQLLEGSVVCAALSSPEFPLVPLPDASNSNRDINIGRRYKVEAWLTKSSEALPGMRRIGLSVIDVEL